MRIVQQYYKERWSFLGPANKFSTKEDAQRYLELYTRRINSSKLNFMRRLRQLKD
jgi:hypothetical protein